VAVMHLRVVRPAKLQAISGRRFALSSIIVLAGVVLVLGAMARARGSAASGHSGAKAVAGNVARDGYFPTPAPTPTPPPLPPVAPQCFQPRPVDLRGYVYLPAAAKSFFLNCQVISYYGYPGVPALGVLGQFGSTEALVAKLREVAADYDGVNGPRAALPAFHLIVASAQPDAYGTALIHMPAETIEQYIAIAQEQDFLVFLDVQMGHSTVEAEVPRLLPYLRNPRVQLAIDPEWDLPFGVVPGAEIGSIDAGEINRAEELLQQVWQETGGPNKILVVHQFTPDMIRRKELLENQPNVDVVIDMDGFGGQAIKLAHYQRFIVEDGAEHSGLKLFYDPSLDTNRFTPAEASEIDPQPDIVQYQ
jgi:hypothetical protein